MKTAKMTAYQVPEAEFFNLITSKESNFEDESARPSKQVRK